MPQKGSYKLQKNCRGGMTNVFKMGHFCWGNFLLENIKYKVSEFFHL